MKSKERKVKEKQLQLDQEAIIDYVARAKSGDEEAFNFLLNYVKKEFKSAQKSKFVSGNEEEDNNQEFSIMLLTAIDQFSEDRNSSFSYYVRLLCQGRINSMIKRSMQHNQYTLNAAQSLDMLVCHDVEGNECRLYDLIPDSNELLSVQLERRDYAEYLKTKLFEFLTELEREVLELHLMEYSYQEIARTLDLRNQETGKEDTKSVDNALQRAKNKIPKIMKDDIEEYEREGGYNFERKRPKSRKYNEGELE